MRIFEKMIKTERVNYGGTLPKNITIHFTQTCTKCGCDAFVRHMCSDKDCPLKEVEHEQ